MAHNIKTRNILLLTNTLFLTAYFPIKEAYQTVFGRSDFTILHFFGINMMLLVGVVLICKIFKID